MRKTLALTLLVLGLVGLPGLVVAQSFEPDDPDQDDTTPNGSAEVDEDSVTFEEGAGPAKGDRIDAEHGTTFKESTSLSMDGAVVHESETEQTESGRNTIEVLEVDDEGEITALRISVHENKTRNVDDGRAQEAESNTVGRTYHVTRDGDGWDVAYCESDDQAEEGDRVPRGEVREMSDMADGSTDNNLRDALTGNTFDVGDDVELDIEEILGQDADEMGLADREFNVTFAGLSQVNGRRTAKFDVVMNMSGEIGPGMTMSMETSGEMFVDVELMVGVSIKLEGPVRIKGGDEHMQIDGTGTFEMTANSEITRND